MVERYETARVRQSPCGDFFRAEWLKPLVQLEPPSRMIEKYNHRIRKVCPIRRQL
jgi:hypothetical protein